MNIAQSPSDLHERKSKVSLISPEVAASPGRNRRSFGPITLVCIIKLITEKIVSIGSSVTELIISNLYFSVQVTPKIVP